MLLLRETNYNIKPEIQVLEENGKQIKNHFLSGTLMQSEQLNKNNRIYPKPILERELFRYGKLIEQKHASSMGELGHPDSPTINLDKVSHRFTEMKMDGNNVVGKARVLDTPNGRIVKSLIDEGLVLGMSTRGLGSVKTEGSINRVQDDFHLATIDIVADPSGPDCFVQGIMEGKDWLFVEGKGWVPQFVEKSQETLKKLNVNDVEKVALMMFENWLDRVTS